MAKLRRTLLIGLGGTGIQAILNAKKMLYENYGEIPPMVGFLGIDTDKPGLKNATIEASDGTPITLSNSEQLAITVDNPRSIYEINKVRELFDWLPESNVSNLDQLSIGAGQTRSNGRFAITVNEKTVENAINRKLSEINDARILDNADYRLLGAEPEVHMVFSLGGGTGSGTFINIAYLIRRIMPEVKLSGYAVLCDVFRAMVPGAMSARVRPNGKGALLDLDFLAHLDVNSDPVSLKWFRQTDSVKERPFTALYLIDNRNDNNDTFSEVRPLCEMISLAIVTSVGELGVALDSVADNVNKLIADNAMDIRDKRAWVAGFGCSEITFDGRRLAEIYQYKACAQIINMLFNGGCDDPSIIANNWFDNNHIRENHGKDDVIDYFIANPNPPYQFQDIDNPENPKPECMQFIENRSQEKNEVLDKKLEALKTRIDAALTDLMKAQANRECGMFLCNNVLHAILKQVEMCDAEMESEKTKLEDNLPKKESALDSACRELAECMSTFFKRGRKGYEEEVVEKTMALARHKREIARRAMAHQFYSWLRERIAQSMHRLDIIMDNLNAVRNQCTDKAQQIIRNYGSGSFFQFDLAAAQSEQVSCPLSDIVFNNFVKAMLDNNGGIQTFSSMDSLETERAIMDYVKTLPKVKQYEATGVDEALESMSDEDLHRLINLAIQKSLPLLPYKYRGYEADLKDRPLETFYIGVSNVKKSRLKKDNIFENNVLNGEKVQFSEIGLKNRIIIYRQLGVIPAFAVSALDNYEVDYDKWERDKPRGSHWDQIMYQRMQAERYSIMPKDEVSEANMLALWIQAVVFGLIQFRNGSYQIQSRALGGRALGGWWVKLGQDRQDAFNTFVTNIEELLPEMTQKLQDMDVPGPDNTLRKNAERARVAAHDGTYVQDISQCPIPMDQLETYPNDYGMLDKEITFIIDNPDFDQMR